MKFPVSEKKNSDIEAEMIRLGINESDLEESFIHSGGPGGQNVNKVATCVVLKHIPSGHIIKCQKHRTQIMNRYTARILLIQKIDSEIHGKKSKEQAKIEKIKRQKRKRSKRAKDKMLKKKLENSQKKDRRKKIHPED